MISTGLIGFGYWGPNLARNFVNSGRYKLISVCDVNPGALDRFDRNYPLVDKTTNPADIFARSDLDVVAIATPVDTHFDLASRCLKSGKHVFIEKPFTRSSDEAKQLIDLAESHKLKLMVDHTYCFSGAVRKIRQQLDEGVLGKLNYFDSMRVNLGKFQRDVNVVWDLMPHDFSILGLIQDNPVEAISVHGCSVMERKQEDIAFATLYLGGNMIAHINVNWLSPVKVRRVLLGGSEKMLVWDDVQVDEKIKVYDKGVDIANPDEMSHALISYRTGNVTSPLIEPVEALSVELEYFADCIETDTSPHNNGEAGLQVVQMLEACDVSLQQGGKLVVP